MDRDDLETLRAFRVQKQRDSKAGGDPPAKKSAFTLRPSTAADPSKPKRLKSDKPGAAARTDEPFNSAALPEPDFVEIDNFSEIAVAESKKVKPSSRVFRSLCATAIAKGGISLQDFLDDFGRAIPQNVDTNLKEWPLPDPETVRNILTLFSSFDSDQFTGSKLPWRHAQSHQSEEVPKLQG
ncbi:MAG: hypothetical protein HRT94_03885 [Alphaproteobacteria bacterium]|nr:hypothetical protein [Alphaproteobacteria bacterium]